MRRKGERGLFGYISLLPAEMGKRFRISPTLPEWERAADAFLAECRRSNFTQSTRTLYRNILLGGRARTFLAEHQLESVGDLSRDLLRDFEMQLYADGLKASSVSVYHRTLSSFLRFCEREGWLADDGVFGLKAPRLPRHNPTTLSPEDEARLLEACRFERDRFLIRFLLRTGVRRRECCNLTIDDYPPGSGVILVRQGKGRKDRAVPLDSPGCRFSRQLTAYIRTVRPQTPCRALFVTMLRDGAEYVPLTPQGLYIVLHRLSEETGIRVSPHILRHTFATRSIAAGLNPAYLQQALGHTTLAMTMRYVHASTDNLIEAWQQRRD